MCRGQDGATVQTGRRRLWAGHRRLVARTRRMDSDHAPPSRRELSEQPGIAAPRSIGPSVGRLFWPLNVVSWSAALAGNVLLNVVFKVPDPPSLAIAEVVLCLLATAGLRWISHREPLLARLRVSNIGVIAAGAMLSVVIVQGLFLVGGPLFGVPKPPRPERIARLMVTLSMIVNWCAFYFGYRLVRDRNMTEVRALQAESLALRHELQHLQAQISPHFLFNALNTVMVCRHDPEATQAVTQALADYLRFLLRPAATLEPLALELDALEDYLTIQGIRFGDGLETSIDCDFGVRGVLVPPVLVQPLVENAIKYGGMTANRPVRVCRLPSVGRRAG